MRKSVLAKQFARVGVAAAVLTLAASAFTGCDLIFPKPLTADFTAVPTEGTAPLEVRFVDLSRAHGGAVASWQWDFGDGTTSTEQHPSHTYTEPGRYAVSLSVADGVGHANTLTKPDYIAVTGLPGSCRVPVEYQKIQEAVDDLQCRNISIESGTYKENLLIARSLTLKGAATVEAFDGTAPVIAIDGSTAVIQVAIDGLIIRGATQSDGIKILGEAEVTVQNSTISDNEVGILVSGRAHATIQGNTITANSLYGVAIFLRECGFPGASACFVGTIDGGANTIERRSGVCPPQGGTVCPSELEFLMTDGGGSYPEWPPSLLALHS
jgi:parallel beta-helix repeat protein